SAPDMHRRRSAGGAFLHFDPAHARCPPRGPAAARPDVLGRRAALRGAPPLSTTIFQGMTTIQRQIHTLLRTTAAAAALSLAPFAGSAWASQAQPGQGVKVTVLKSSLAEESFQTLIVIKALQQLGYDVPPYKEVEYPLAHMAVASGDATLMANHWNPHHSEFYKAAGGDAKLSRKGVYSAGAAQGYMIDKKT